MLARPEPALLRVNLGCGASPTLGWLNFDNSPSARLGAMPWLWPMLSPIKRQWAQAARKANIRHGVATRLPLSDGSVGVLYSSHMMEHLDRQEAQVFLGEAFRVMAPGGVIRLALPDIRRMCAAYLEHGDADEFVHETRMGTHRPRTAYEWLKYLTTGPRHHLWMYDATSLVKHLTAAGFVEARELKPGETTIIDPGPLDLHERADASVYVEAARA